jgi:PAS domain S-box-containing protein
MKISGMQISPLSRLFIIVLSIVASEMLVMLFLPYLDHFSRLVGSIIDGSILLFIITPSIYFLLTKPFIKEIGEKTETSSRLSTLLASTSDMIIRIGSDYVCRYINPSCSRYLPLKPEDFIGKHLERFHELGLENNFIQDLINLTEATFDSREKQEIEIYLNNHYFHAESVPERDNGNNVSAVVIIAHDISDRKKIEHAMHKNLQLLTKAIETTQVGFTVTDKNGIIIYLNASEAEMHGYTVSEADMHGFTVNELVGRDIEILSPKDFSRPLTEAALIALKRWKRESINVRKDGSTFPVQLMSDVVMNDDGGVVAIVTSCENISERKQLEEKIKRQNEHLDELVQARTSELDETLDKLKQSQELLQRHNESLEQLAQGSITELYETIGELKYNQEQLKQHNEHLDELVQARTSELYKTLDELKQSQEQLIQSAKMASLGILTAGVAHEINNPLSFVYGNIGNLEKFMGRLFSLLEIYEKIELSSDVKSEIENFKKEINYDHIINRMESLIGKTKEGANRIKKIVLDLKNFARLDISDITDMDVNESIDVTLDLLYHEYKNRIVISKEYGKIPKLQCYAAKINQVLMNLMLNACQAIDGEGEVKIRTSTDNETVDISITDNGKGIPPEIQARIFDPFFTTKPVGVGTGLGLSISYKIIKEHGGEILVKSAPGEGSEFTVKIPIAMTKGAAHPDM